MFAVAFKADGEFLQMHFKRIEFDGLINRSGDGWGLLRVRTEKMQSGAFSTCTQTIRVYTKIGKYQRLCQISFATLSSVIFLFCLF